MVGGSDVDPQLVAGRDDGVSDDSAGEAVEHGSADRAGHSRAVTECSGGAEWARRG